MVKWNSWPDFRRERVCLIVHWRFLSTVILLNLWYLIKQGVQNPFCVDGIFFIQDKSGSIAPSLGHLNCLRIRSSKQMSCLTSKLLARRRRLCACSLSWGNTSASAEKYLHFKEMIETWGYLDWPLNCLRWIRHYVFHSQYILWSFSIASCMLCVWHLTCHSSPSCLS